MRTSVGFILLAFVAASAANPVAEPVETCFALQPPGMPQTCIGNTAVPSNNNYYYRLDSIQSVNVGVCCSVKGYSNGEEYWFRPTGYLCDFWAWGVPWEVTSPQFPEIRCHVRSGDYAGSSFQWHYASLALDKGQSMEGVVNMRKPRK